MTGKKYKVVITQSGKADVKEKKKYILLHFKYREYAENYSRKIKKAAKRLERFPTGQRNILMSMRLSYAVNVMTGIKSGECHLALPAFKKFLTALLWNHMCPRLHRQEHRHP